MKNTDKLTPMAGWYNPAQLIDTAKKTLISKIIGANADPRLVAPAPADGAFFDYSEEFDPEPRLKGDKIPRRMIGLDYVSDVGDGFNSTYSIAYTLARESLDVAGYSLHRGEILIFGGDAVYPTASSEEYQRKLTTPYRMAFNAGHLGADGEDDKTDLKKNPHVFALPGNHDWYDSLVSFQRLFCTKVFNNREFAGGWRTRQSQSYFALRLPQKWWLLGIDLQLSHNIDVPQLQYFESIVMKMTPGDRAILCVPEPYWVKAIKYRKHGEAFESFKQKEESVELLEAMLRERGVEIKVYISGDLHHYRRLESDDGRRVQKITAGGGGAFLHPTHDFDATKAPIGSEISETALRLQKQYPEPVVSRSLDWKIMFGFIRKNPLFGIVTAGLYLILALLIRGMIKGDFSWTAALAATANRLISEPLALMVVVVSMLALIFFTDSHSKSYRRAAGAVHFLAHLTAIFFLGWSAYLLSQWISARYEVGNETLHNFVWVMAVAGVCGIGGYLVGSFIMGLYLFVSIHFFGRHDNEAFAALRIEDYKNFLRMQIDENGCLTIYSIKLERVGRKWDRAENSQGLFFTPRVALKPELIERIESVS